MTERERKLLKKLLRDALALKRRAAAGLARTIEEERKFEALRAKWRADDDASRKRGRRTVKPRAAAKRSAR